jgi:sugar/nucleoside kinase (ribokinase family)
MALTPGEMLRYLRERGCRIGGVTMGPRGLVWYDETGSYRVLPALYVPSEQVIDTNGAGDIFHGAYVYSALTNPGLSWEELSASHARRPPTLFNISATRRACRPSPILMRLRPASANGARVHG